MSLTLLQAPTDQVISAADLKQQVRVDLDVSDEDDWLNMCVAAVHNHVDGASGVLGRALLTQQWRLERGGFCQEIEIPLPPLQTIDSIKYLDPDGVEQTASTSLYRVVNNGGGCAKVVLKVGQSWPVTLCAPDAVRITFTAGYDDIEDLTARHASIPQAMLLFAAHLYENREGVTDSSAANAPAELPYGIECLLSPHRVQFF